MRTTTPPSALVDDAPPRLYTRRFTLVMIQLTSREKWLAGIVLLSILVGVTVHHVRHLGSGSPKGPTPVAGHAKVLR